MIGLIQRVTNAQVIVDSNVCGAIESGILALIGVTQEDDSARMKKLADRIMNYRIFADQNGKMNLNVKQINGGLLLVPQFTLAADTQSGLRPSFSTAAPPQMSEQLFQQLVDYCQQQMAPVASGVFGADMDVHLCNQGPATFWLES
ncbi:MAG: D-tyrosyl-tRNA(Tyr) deacylase [Gammaproteobacteria bacterium]|nr:D-tyrosyl-tRNA(Tyr) deacylase [Gammaproteobacteria bacterium]